jgi:hypothetical protein
MNDLIQLLLQTALKAGAGALVTHGLATGNQAQDFAAVVMALAALVWSHVHLKSKTAPASVTITTSGNAKPPLMLLAWGLVLAGLVTGCTSAINSGHVVSVTERGFGIIIAQSTQNQSPEIKLGFFSSAIVLEPCVTNATLTVPDFANTFALDQAASPFSFGVDETIASGRYQTGNPLSPSNSIASQPIVPK